MKTKSGLSVILWTVVYLIIGIALYFLLKGILGEKADIVAVISILGVYTTLYSFVLMLVQFKSIRQVSEETKTKLNNSVAISDLSTYSEMIRSLESDVRADSLDVALYKTQNIKGIVHKIELLEGKDKKNDQEFADIYSILATHISSYNDRLISENNTELNKSVILKELEQISTFFQKKANKYIDNI